MIRLIRTRTLRNLRAEITEADEAAAVYSAEADKWNEYYVAEVQRADDAEQALAHTAELRGEDQDHHEEQLAELREQLAAGRPALGAGTVWGRIDQDVTTAAAESAGHVAARATEHKEAGQ